MTKPRPILDEMPLHIKEKIADGLSSYRDGAALRKVSRTFRSVIDGSMRKCNYLDVDVVGGSSINISFETRCGVSYEFVYRDHEAGCRVCISKDSGVEFEKLVPGANMMDMALRDLESFLMIPRLEIQSLSLVDSSDVDFDGRAPRIDEFYEYLRCSLSKLPIALPVRKFEMSYLSKQQHVMSVLPFLDPRSLNSIDLFESFSLEPLNTPLDTDQILGSEQWRSAEKIRMTIEGTANSIDHCLRDYSCITMALDKISVDEIKRLLEYCLTSASFECRVIFGNFDENRVVEMFESHKSRISWETRSETRYGEFEMTNSSDTLEICVSNVRIDFTRQKKN